MPEHTPVDIMLRERTEKIADEVVEERVRAAAEHGFDPDHDREHGLDHLIDWAMAYLRDARAERPNLRAQREELLKAAGLVLSGIDLIDHVEDED